MKKNGFTFILFGAITMVLTACGGGGSSSTETDTAKPDIQSDTQSDIPGNDSVASAFAQVPFCNEGYSIAKGDIDGDGDIDLVGNCVFLNQGDGNFLVGMSGLVQPETVTLGDIDGDGDLDLVAGYSSYSMVSFNNGNGNFVVDTEQLLLNDPVSQTSTLPISSGKLVDIDSDKDLDLLAVHSAGGMTMVFLNDGKGVFSDSGQTIPRANSLEVGDVDGDGDMDLLAGNLYLNDGRGNFSDSGQVVGDQQVQVQALADLDGDGDLDLAVARNKDFADFSGANRIYFNDGRGTFSDSTQRLGSSNTYGLTLGDIDNDGDMDLIFGNNLDNGTEMFLNDGKGIFTNSGQNLGHISDINVAFDRTVLLADLDGDGDQDLVAAAIGKGFVRTYSNDGTGAFTTTHVFDGAVTKDIALGDLDGDGDLDAVLGNGSEFAKPDRILINDGGHFRRFGKGLGDAVTRAIAVADVDADGDLDIAAGGCSGSNLVSIYLNDGTASFTDSQALGNDPRYNDCLNDLAFADLDGDGDQDIATGNAGHSHVYLNAGNGTFTDSGLELSAAKAIALTDVDNDGDMDFIADRVYLNDGAAGFVATDQELNAGIAPAIAAGDLNGDGNIDLVIAENSRGARVWLNNGDTTFTDKGLFDDKVHNTSIALEDMDKDGDLDVVLGRYYGSVVFLNDGSAGFTEDVSYDDKWTNSIAVGDVDGDGTKDLFFAGDIGGYLQLGR